VPETYYFYYLLCENAFSAGPKTGVGGVRHRNGAVAPIKWLQDTPQIRKKTNQEASRSGPRLGQGHVVPNPQPKRNEPDSGGRLKLGQKCKNAFAILQFCNLRAMPIF
jgi:hypothetical protein